MPDDARNFDLGPQPPGVPGMECLRTPHTWSGARSLTLIEGQVPADLDGRLYRVGPGRFEKDGQVFPHWFDGEGLVVSVDIANGAATARCNLVDDPHPKTPAPVPDDRGRFGLAPTSVWKRIQSIWTADTYVNPANTALLYWNKRLFGLFEGGLPTELDPQTLHSLGKTDLGVVRRAFSAHPKYHARSDSWFNQGFRTAPRPILDYVRMMPDGTAERFASVPYKGALFTHDFAITDKYIISICSPMFADAAAVIFGGKPLSEVLEWQPDRGTEIIVIPIDNPNDVRHLTGPPIFYSHTANAFEQDGKIIVRGIVAPDASNMAWVNAVARGANDLPRGSIGVLSDVTIDLSTDNVSVKTVENLCMDFPQINPAFAGKSNQFVYVNGFLEEAEAYGDLFDAVMKVDVKGKTVKRGFGKGHYVSEPVFVGRADADAALGSDEDDGYLLTINYDAAADDSYLAIQSATGALDVLARLSFGQSLPMSFHGMWVTRNAL